MKEDIYMEFLTEKLTLEQKKTKKRRRVGRPSGKTKKNYSFTLKPSNRDLLDELAEQAGYTSASNYLDDCLEQQKNKNNFLILLKR